MEAEIELCQELHFSGYVDEARAAYEHCLTLAERYSDSDHEGRAILAKTLMGMGTFEVHQGQLSDAESHLRRALGYFNDLQDDRKSISCVHRLVDMLLGQDKLSEAENLCRQSFQECVEAYGSENIHTLDTIRKLGRVLGRSDRTDEALEMYMRALEGYRRTNSHWFQTLSTMCQIAHVLAKQRKMWEAASLLEQVYQLSIDHYGPESSFTINYGEIYAFILWILEKYDQAIELTRSCATISRRTLGSDYGDAVRRARLVPKWERA